MFCFSGRDNVVGVSACLREKDHVIIVMPYFPHDKFQVTAEFFAANVSLIYILIFWICKLYFLTLGGFFICLSVVFVA